MTAISIQAMDLPLDLPHDVAVALVFTPEADRAPGMPLLGFVVATVMSVLLWTLIGFTTWTLLT